MIKCNDTCPLDKFKGCCHSCPDFGTCPEECSSDPATCENSTMEEETALQEFKTNTLTILQQIATVVKAKKQVEDQEKELKAQLQTAMEKYGVKKFESDVLNLTYVAPTTATSVDSAKLKKNYPDIYADCSKTSAKAGYVKIVLKD